MLIAEEYWEYSKIFALKIVETELWLEAKFCDWKAAAMGVSV